MRDLLSVLPFSASPIRVPAHHWRHCASWRLNDATAVKAFVAQFTISERTGFLFHYKELDLITFVRDGYFFIRVHTFVEIFGELLSEYNLSMQFLKT